MDKLKMHTPNKADENFKKLAEMFPMFQLTAEGLEAGMKRLMVRR